MPYPPTDSTPCSPIRPTARAGKAIWNGWLEAIVALPLNMFYNTGIATYIWVLTNRKPAQRRGKVQLIDATGWSRPLRKNLGKKNCELADEDIRRICDIFLAFEESEQSKIFPNAAFGYRKVIVEHPCGSRSSCRWSSFGASGTQTRDPSPTSSTGWPQHKAPVLIAISTTSWKQSPRTPPGTESS